MQKVSRQISGHCSWVQKCRSAVRLQWCSTLCHVCRFSKTLLQSVKDEICVIFSSFLLPPPVYFQTRPSTSFLWDWRHNLYKRNASKEVTRDDPARCALLARANGNRVSNTVMRTSYSSIIFLVKGFDSAEQAKHCSEHARPHTHARTLRCNGAQNPSYRLDLHLLWLQVFV